MLYILIYIYIQRDRENPPVWDSLRIAPIKYCQLNVTEIFPIYGIVDPIYEHLVSMVKCM